MCKGGARAHVNFFQHRRKHLWFLCRASVRREPGRGARKLDNEPVPQQHEGGRSPAGPGGSDRQRRNSRKQGTGGNRRDHNADFVLSRGSPSDASHLLGFRYHEELPAHAAGHSNRGGGRRSRGRGNNRPAAPRRAFKKENFLQASYRFVVSDAVDTGKHESDPDAMFDWEDVLQARSRPDAVF